MTSSGIVATRAAAGPRCDAATTTRAAAHSNARCTRRVARSGPVSGGRWPVTLSTDQTRPRGHEQGGKGDGDRVPDRDVEAVGQVDVYLQAHRQHDGEGEIAEHLAPGDAADLQPQSESSEGEGSRDRGALHPASA